jgi:hypothetical protein
LGKISNFDNYLAGQGNQSNQNRTKETTTCEKKVMTKNIKILTCGDSFVNTDSDFPGLHLTEKILDFSSYFELINLSFGGCSNAMITLQLLQGLNLNPDFVILSFTNEHRYESDGDIESVPFNLTANSISAYIKERYKPNTTSTLLTLSENFEKIKNYFHIMFCLQTLKEKKVNFCFSLGGFEYQQDYTALLRSNFIENNIFNKEFILYTKSSY